MIWQVFMFVIFCESESYVLLQVRKNDGNSSNIDALIHKEVPSIQLDKFTDAMEKLIQGKTTEKISTTGKQSLKSERRGNEIKLHLEDIEKQDSPTMEKLDFGTIKIANVKDNQPAFRSHSGKHAPEEVVSVFTLDGDRVARALNRVLSSPKLRAYVDKLSRKVAATFRALEDSFRS